MEGLIFLFLEPILLLSMSKVAIGIALTVGGGTAIGIAIKNANDQMKKNDEEQNDQEHNS